MLLDTNVVIRHLTGEPAEQAAPVTQMLMTTREPLMLLDVVVAECVFVLQRVYRLERHLVADLLRRILSLPVIVVEDEALALRALHFYRARGSRLLTPTSQRMLSGFALRSCPSTVISIALRGSIASSRAERLLVLYEAVVTTLAESR